MTNINRIASISALAFLLCSVASAQLTLTGAFSRSEQTNIRDYTGLPVGSGTFVGGAVELWLDGEFSIYPVVGSNAHSFETFRYYSVQVGGDVVSITNLAFLRKGRTGFDPGLPW